MNARCLSHSTFLTSGEDPAVVYPRLLANLRKQLEELAGAEEDIDYMGGLQGEIFDDLEFFDPNWMEALDLQLPDPEKVKLMIADLEYFIEAMSTVTR